MNVTLTAADERARDAVRQAIILIITATLVLTILGVVMVFSATSVTSISMAVTYDDPSARFAVAQRQLIFALVGLVFLPIAALIPGSFYKRAVWPIYGLGIVLQLLVLTPLSLSGGGNTNWISLGGVVLQPSEFLKLASALWLGVMLGRLSREDMANPRTVLVPAGAGAFASLAAVLLGQDMGTAIIYVVMFAVAFYLAGMPGKWFAMVALAVGVVGSILIVSQRSRLNRVIDYVENIFITPDAVDPTQSEYAMWAFGTGGIGGVGLGASREKWNYLPEAHNDFIFAVVGEELGFFGALAVILLYLVLGYGFYRIVANHSETWVRYVVAMIAMWLVGQAVLNMMVVTGVLPVFGVPLPFISQGGSALIACLLAVGVVISLALRQPGVARSMRPSRMSYKSTASLRSTR
ncbi:FtsW/RodA/SpoVE family cell cycle protein [Flaviflexus equikiangi]|uniref:Probable peptidoglycan glycosyltransferase FtsW n=1 Tax=Flaviflexus equikiangi TaxID=2758573 RepID=A0ABS2TER6_9ACTO|nr:FtsW/RodA/SpoVE family cell cycle protein [Flaviflexus equikiangi]MBM9433155.1 FtsW/RodA/SpoVE family cell cycle protein [Flaviflexus equikiangi]